MASEHLNPLITEAGASDAEGLHDGSWTPNVQVVLHKHAEPDIFKHFLQPPRTKTSSIELVPRIANTMVVFLETAPETSKEPKSSHVRLRRAHKRGPHSGSQNSKYVVLQCKARAKAFTPNILCTHDFFRPETTRRVPCDARDTLQAQLNC